MNVTGRHPGRWRAGWENALVDVGVLTAIAHFPVKSMLGESLPAAEVDARGLVGDRGWAVADATGRLGSGKTTRRRFRRMEGLLDYRASRCADGRVSVRAPDGQLFDVADPALGWQLTRHLGLDVTVEPEEAGTMHFDEGPVSLATTAAVRSIAAAHGEPVDVRRFRANLLVELAADGYPEDDWVERDITVGDVVLRGRNRLQRCALVARRQEELGEDDRLLRTLAAVHDFEFALLADVVRPGTVRVGDAVRVS